MIIAVCVLVNMAAMLTLLDVMLIVTNLLLVVGC